MRELIPTRMSKFLKKVPSDDKGIDNKMVITPPNHRTVVIPTCMHGKERRMQDGGFFSFKGRTRASFLFLAANFYHLCPKDLIEKKQYEQSLQSFAKYYKSQYFFVQKIPFSTFIPRDTLRLLTTLKSTQGTKSHQGRGVCIEGRTTM